MFSNAVKLFSISGFDIKIDPSWLIIFALITWSLSQHYFPTSLPGETGGVYVSIAITATILFFASLLLHELAHAVVARHYGLPIGGITLFLFGGVAEMEAEPRSPEVEFLVAIAGPIMSIALSVSFLFLSWIAAIGEEMTIVASIFSYLATINLILAIFNLVPAFPLDGGRIFRAYMWHRTGNLLRATEIAAKSGILFAFILMGFGVISLFQGAITAAIWQIMIGGFLLVAARSSYQSQLTKVVFDKRTVRDLMKTPPITVEPDVSLADFVKQIVLRNGLSFVPVVENGVLLGHINHALLSGIDRENWPSTRVGDVFAELNASPIVDPDVSIEDLMNKITTTGQRKFLVVKDGKLLGVISLSDLVRHLQLSDLMTPK
jgi:Zn-dependent protease/predicted transcriptional regulator